jgi:anti-anti-sigma factor
VDSELFGSFEMPGGSIAVLQEAAGCVMYLSGDVDAPVIKQWETEQDSAVVTVVAVDVGELAYIDSTGLSFLVRWAQKARRDGRPPVLLRTTSRFEKVLNLAGLTSLFVMDGGSQTFGRPSSL